MKILVADDSKTNLALITSSLQRLGHQVIAAKNGKEAIEQFIKEPPDLIILDVVMEEMDGFECATRLREINSQEWIPIIFLSASVDDTSIAKGINAGGDDYITKPFSEITLEAKIKAMQRISEMRKKLFNTALELKVLSSTDTLTGTYNRFQFEKSIKEKLAAADRHGMMLAVMFIDLDHFKAVNDTFGHHIGDLLIKEAAARLKKCLRIDDFIARIGGDEFVLIIMNKDSMRVAEKVAKKILAAISQTFELEKNIIRISASIGIACYPTPDTTHETIVQNADIAMYHAKELGRNNFQFYSTELSHRYRKQISLEHELKFALERKQFLITYQPIYNLLTKKIAGMEALLRWNHDEFGIISPNVFIPIAENTGLITQIGNWALEEVCKQGAIWCAMGYTDFKLFVNLSLHQFLQENIVEVIKNILQKTHFPASFLELELTETSLISYSDHLKRKLNELNTLGLTISIDDFGTRYSSLASLRSLPIATLKIDKDFLDNIEKDVKNSIIVRALIALGTNLHLNVIAEGIENDEQVQFLLLNGCFLGQGFFLSQPLSEEQMTALLKELNPYKEPMR
ncbi:MAG: EAL domain-containing protein [Gammaproteobacteria bacterium]|nr:EAL domain-containing protein [Gammaproteobacteria bacterium]